MELVSLKFSSEDGFTRSEATVRSPASVSGKFTVRFDFRRALQEPPNPGDAWLAALLPPAMFTGEDLVINARVSPRIARQAHQVRDMLHAWFPAAVHPIRIVTPQLHATPERSESAAGTCSFFSGGADSWYTLQVNTEEITQLVTVKGFDVPVTDTTLWTDLTRANRQITGALGKELILVETDIRDKLDPNYKVFHRHFEHDFWGECMHGSCMGAVSLFLESITSRAYIPGSMDYTFLPPWGSHPLLDPLWSNDRVRIYHHGCEYLRMEKMRHIVKSDLVLEHLRVCTQARPGRYNCGHCEKCKRTMMALRLLGVLSKSRCFDTKLDLSDMEFMDLAPIYFPTYTEILNEAQAVGDKEIERLAQVLMGQRRSIRRDFYRVKNKASRILPRWRRSLMKRLHPPGKTV